MSDSVLQDNGVTHNGTDAPQIDPRDLLGFSILSAAPTWSAPNGTIVFTSIAGVFKIYVRFPGAWKSAALT